MRRKINFWLWLSVMTVWPAAISLTQNRSAPNLEAEHRLFDLALQKHVQDGLVDYQAMAREQNFQKYVNWLKSVDAASFNSKTEELAFWINAYNALAIQGVITSYPLESVLKAPGFFNKKKHPVARQQLTLDQIEKGVIFRKFKNPKLHFVLVCAARSCPNLPDRAYSSENVFDRIEEVARIFLNNPQKNRLDRENKIFYLSQIFNWYQKDFLSENRSILNFIRPYLEQEKQVFLAENPVTIKYLEYDWNLNSQQ
ncbi:MAG: DUF547 domain-containing protein [bacterium]